MNTKKEKQPAVRPRPIVLCILDGWGYSENAAHNAICSAETPHWDRFLQQYPHSLLEAGGLNVGLPEGQFGNSEVGHMNIGSGRVVMQSLPRINQAVKNGVLAKHPDLQALIGALKKTGGTCHLMGLVSDGGVHAHVEHIIALAEIVAGSGIAVAVHAFLDGRDAAPGRAPDNVMALENALRKYPHARIATVGGRYYGMDRDTRWERVRQAHDAMVLGRGTRIATAQDAIKRSYDQGKTDEFITPVVIGDYMGMENGDGLIMANFRADRARQILSALLDPEFAGFKREKKITFSAGIGMVEYSAMHNRFLKTLFPAEPLTRILPEIVAEMGLKQLRIAETEKYAHVTFFFNGGEEKEFPGEKRILVPSPKVATYDTQPEMAALEVTDKLVEAIHSARFDLIVVNYANTDMVGHTGIEAAAVKAVETVDGALGRLEEAVLEQGGVLLVTADHGNVEQMVDERGAPHTQHTLNPVPLVVIGAGRVTLCSGRLSDIAPTILHFMKVPQPKEMTGRCLVV